MSSLYLERSAMDNVTEAGIRKIIKACSTVQMVNDEYKLALSVRSQAELRQMSKKELDEYIKQLRTLSEFAEVELARRVAIKARRDEVKANYPSLINRDYTYHVNDVALKKLIEDSLRAGKPVNEELYAEFTQKATVQDHKPRQEAYPCPHCGKFTLYPAYHDQGYRNEKATINCDADGCDFEIKVDNKYCFGDKASWWGLEDWLVKHGYMQESDKVSRGACGAARLQPGAPRWCNSTVWPKSSTRRMDSSV